MAINSLSDRVWGRLVHSTRGSTLQTGAPFGLVGAFQQAGVGAWLTAVQTAQRVRSPLITLVAAYAEERELSEEYLNGKK